MLTGMLPRSTAALPSLDMSKRALALTSADGKLRAEHAYLAGAVSGVAESLGFAPFQVIKVRCQQSGGGGERGSWQLVLVSGGGSGGEMPAG